MILRFHVKWLGDPEVFSPMTCRFLLGRGGQPKIFSPKFNKNRPAKSYEGPQKVAGSSSIPLIFQEGTVDSQLCMKTEFPVVLKKLGLNHLKRSRVGRIGT